MSPHDLYAGNMPSHCHGLQDGFEIVYGKGRGPRGQASAASRLAPRPAPTAQTTSQPARQPPPQVKTLSLLVFCADDIKAHVQECHDAAITALHAVIPYGLRHASVADQA